MSGAIYQPKRKTVCFARKSYWLSQKDDGSLAIGLSFSGTAGDDKKWTEERLSAGSLIGSSDKAEKEEKAAETVTLCIDTKS